MARAGARKYEQRDHVQLRPPRQWMHFALAQPSLSTFTILSGGLVGMPIAHLVGLGPRTGAFSLIFVQSAFFLISLSKIALTTVLVRSDRFAGRAVVHPAKVTCQMAFREFRCTATAERSKMLTSTLA